MIIACILVFVMIFAFVGCDKGPKPDEPVYGQQYIASSYADIPAGPHAALYLCDLTLTLNDTDNRFNLNFKFDPNNSASYEDIDFYGTYELGSDGTLALKTKMNVTVNFTKQADGFFGSLSKLFAGYDGDAVFQGVQYRSFADNSSQLMNSNMMFVKVSPIKELKSDMADELARLEAKLYNPTYFNGFYSEATRLANVSIISTYYTYIKAAVMNSATKAEMQNVVDNLAQDALDIAKDRAFATVGGSGGGVAVNTSGSNKITKGTDTYYALINKGTSVITLRKEATDYLVGQYVIIKDGDTNTSLIEATFTIDGTATKFRFFVLADGTTIDCFGMPLNATSTATADRTFDNFGLTVIG